MSRRSSIPFGNAVHTALSFPVLGEDVLITGAGPIGIMAAAVVRARGRAARRRHRREPVPARAGAQAWARRSRSTSARATLADVQSELGMKEGFDVGLEMSGNPAALPRHARQHGARRKIAMLGIPDEEIAIDWNSVIFNMLTIKGIYGREMYETWYKMTVMLQSGLDISPVITHRFHYGDFEKAFAMPPSGECGKVVLDWEQ